MQTKEEMERDIKDSIEKMTQAIMQNGAGHMLASGMSESAVVNLCYKTSKLYHEGLVNRYKNELNIPEE